MRLVEELRLVLKTFLNIQDIGFVQCKDKLGVESMSYDNSIYSMCLLIYGLS